MPMRLRPTCRLPTTRTSSTGPACVTATTGGGVEATVAGDTSPGGMDDWQGGDPHRRTGHGPAPERRGLDVHRCRRPPQHARREFFTGRSRTPPPAMSRIRTRRCGRARGGRGEAAVPGGAHRRRVCGAQRGVPDQDPRHRRRRAAAGRARHRHELRHRPLTKEILLDEKIGGTIHLAVGMSYPRRAGRTTRRSIGTWSATRDRAGASPWTASHCKSTVASILRKPLRNPIPWYPAGASVASERSCGWSLVPEYDRRVIALHCRGCKRANAEPPLAEWGDGGTNFGANPPL